MTLCKDCGRDRGGGHGDRACKDELLRQKAALVVERGLEKAIHEASGIPWPTGGVK